MNNYEINNEKGKHILNASKFSQAVLFDNFGKGQLRPTDYDAVFEYQNKYWFGFEVKQKGKEMPYGQKLSYTRNADRWNESNKVGMVFLVEHEEYDVNQPIMLTECKLKEFYFNGKWTKSKYKTPITVAELLKKLGQKFNIDILK